MKPIDLEAILPKLAGVRLIGFGEVVHGSTKLHREMGATAIGLIEKLGVNQIFIEAPGAAVKRVNELISPGSRRRIQVTDLLPIYRIWRTEGFAAFLESLRIYNQNSNDPVNLSGFDIRGPIDAIELIRRTVELSEEKREGTDWFLSDLAIEGLRELEDEAALYATRSQGSSQKYLQLKRSLLAGIDQLKRNGASDEIQSAIVDVELWISFYDTLLESGVQAAYLARDRGMFKKIFSSLGDFPSIIIAHFAHLLTSSEALVERPDIMPDGPVLGTHLKRRLKDGYAHIGFASPVTPITLFDGSNMTYQAESASFEVEGIEYESGGFVDFSAAALERKTITIGQITEKRVELVPSYSKIKFNSGEQVDFFRIVP